MQKCGAHENKFLYEDGVYRRDVRQHLQRMSEFLSAAEVKDAFLAIIEDLGDELIRIDKIHRRRRG